MAVPMRIEFEEYVMSDAGDAFLDSFYRDPESWTDVITNTKNQEKGLKSAS